MKILMPVDGSEYSRRMLAYVAAHDELLGAQHSYTLLHVVAPIPAYMVRGGVGGSLEDYYREVAEEVLHPLRSFVEHHGWNASLEHRAGHAAETIAQCAAEGGYDLIVMGTHGRTGLPHLVLGSVANGVLAGCRLPVLLIR